MARSTLEDQGEGQDLYRRQKCNNGVPISTRYETSTITTTYVTYSYHTPPPRSTDLSPETSRPPPSSRTYYTLHTLRPPGPQITIRPSTSTTRLPPKKSVVSTTSDIIPKARAIQGVPVTITRTVVTRIPVETIYSCPLPSREPITSRAPPTSRNGFPMSRSSREPPTSREPATSFSRDPPTTWVEPTSRSNRPTSLRTNTTESTEHPSTRHESTTSSREPWYPISAPSTPTSRDRPTSPPSTFHRGHGIRPPSYPQLLLRQTLL
ncbi:hypothetical protein B0J17DRAFT_105041 [Rhizoctonia solani]|nr:hypothetical protein B0J17DRAFT_105041 [Rhizoctonia solani]